MDRINFNPDSGLVPAVIQEDRSRRVLMLGYMNRDSLKRTLETGKVTFYSRSRKRLWTKGEESGNFLHYKSHWTDCDGDALLVFARPAGPVCHTGSETCFRQRHDTDVFFLDTLGQVIEDRKDFPVDESYTSSLFRGGIEMISRKVGEEAVELILESISGSDERVLEEAADLLFHLIVLLRGRELGLADVCRILEKRRTLSKG